MARKKEVVADVILVRRGSRLEKSMFSVLASNTGMSLEDVKKAFGVKERPQKTIRKKK